MIDFPKEVMDKFGLTHNPVRNGTGRRGGGGIDEPPIEFRKNGRLRRELLTADAERWADRLYNSGKGVSSTQLRKFFNEVKALQSRIEAEGFEANDALVGMLKPKAAYALKRAEKKKKGGYENLCNMIEQCVELCRSKDDFNDFALFFEAVMGFFKEGR